MFDLVPDDLADALRRRGGRPRGDESFRFVSETESTNDLALALAAAGAADGLAVLADRQRAGRGRRGRSWFSPAGAGIYLSVVVRLDEAPVTLSLLTLAVGVAAAEAVLAASGLPVEVKWPNDLVVGRPWRKLGGLLCESSGAGGRVDAVVVGIGINRLSAAYPPELVARATSLESELGRPIDRGPLVVALLDRLGDRMDQIRRGEDERIRRDWRRLGRAGLGAADVRWQDRGVERTGVARDIDVDGALLVDADGRTERLVAGEVIWDRLSHV
jgi:BirA family biotin operon repressor/biotin-[acetyl-CoA-carboxylase] ligase